MDEIFVAHDLRQFPSNGTVDVLDDIEVGWKEDVKVALVDLILLISCSPSKKRKWEKHTNGVDTGTVRLMYRVCTTGEFIPGTASGRVLKSLAINLCAGK